jgi:hypothetical protein
MHTEYRYEYIVNRVHWSGHGPCQDRNRGTGPGRLLFVNIPNQPYDTQYVLIKTKNKEPKKNHSSVIDRMTEAKEPKKNHSSVIYRMTDAKMT